MSMHTHRDRQREGERERERERERDTERKRERERKRQRFNEDDMSSLPVNDFDDEDASLMPAVHNYSHRPPAQKYQTGYQMQQLQQQQLQTGKGYATLQGTNFPLAPHPQAATQHPPNSAASNQMWTSHMQRAQQVHSGRASMVEAPVKHEFAADESSTTPDIKVARLRKDKKREREREREREKGRREGKREREREREKMKERWGHLQLLPGRA